LLRQKIHRVSWRFCGLSVYPIRMNEYQYTSKFRNLRPTLSSDNA